MYFFPHDSLQRVRDAGLAVPDAAAGRFTDAGTPGWIVNPDAITLDALQPYAATIAGRPDAGAVELHTTETGLWWVQTRPARGPADRSRETPTGQRAPDPVTVVRGGADARRRTAPLARFQACQRPRHGERRVDTVTIVFAALSHYEPRLPGPVTVLERLACPEVRGLPAPTDLPADGRAIVIGAVPGSGRLDMRAHRRLHLRSPLVDDSHYVQIPHAEIPEGMQPVALNGLPVACYDDRMLVLFADVGEIAAYLVPLWLERCACPQSPTDADQDAARMAAARIRPAHSPSEQAELTRRDIQSCQASLARLDSEIAALQDQLAALPEAPDPEALTEQIRALAAAGDWTVFDHAADIVFELADPVVIDPRDGTRRRIDPAPQVSLKSWLAHRGALGARGTPEHDRHPRLLGNGFLDPAVEAAVNEFGQAGDLAGGLELIRDVLTAFQPDDPGLALLDDWPAA